ncbi:MAG TPA: beta-glucuronidase [Lachnospiraceae bacterium]|nr:beta-glucuronidase [Lachnospiraceae bacterium]
MIKNYNLKGEWNFALDGEKAGIDKAFYSLELNDTIQLPSTTALSGKGSRNTKKEIGFLTEVFPFEGYAWFKKVITIDKTDIGKQLRLYLERTRLTKVWIDGMYVGEGDSLTTPHIYDITSYIKKETFTVTVMVSNTDYPTKGGHLTSPDTQTNWNGITGRIELQVFDDVYVKEAKAYSDIEKKEFKIALSFINIAKKTMEYTFQIGARAVRLDGKDEICEIAAEVAKEYTITLNGEETDTEVIYPLSSEAFLWSEYNPTCYEIVITGVNGECTKVFTGLRKFAGEKDKFTINGTPTFLRGKHDGLIFPLTGAAPTTVEEWIKILKISKDYGINHYRFHTCCPPEAAFIAADLLGIYMQPELPFWGTLTDESYENHNEVEQKYLITEGERMLDSYGNHASYVMMSLGNELWGSKEKMGEILRGYKKRDPRPMYTQGSNNFQHAPVIIEEDDFFSGVRLSKERLFRGSYGMCDAPLGHVQMTEPGTCKDYDEVIVPTAKKDANNGDTTTKTIEIQYGTGTKTVEMNEEGKELVPRIPVVSHEIGQYAVYPNFKEMEKYTGVLRAYNFEEFKNRLEEKGLSDLADKYFEATGKLSVACYKEELEAAFASRNMAGFQILDIQDFSGQGTALVGILDAFMESKGHVTPKEWRSFCSDAVILVRMPSYIYESSERFEAPVHLSYFNDKKLVDRSLTWEVLCGDTQVAKGAIQIEDNLYGQVEIGRVSFTMPDYKQIEKLTLHLFVEGTSMDKNYDLWCYPAITNSTIRREDLMKDSVVTKDGIPVYITKDVKNAQKLLNQGERVLLIPEKVEKSIEGFYCSDFWCYPMFRSISEWMKKPEPIGTMGLLNNTDHKALATFTCDEYATPQWYHIVSHADMAILDETDHSYRPIVQMIDNIERNHKLGLLFEAKVGNGSLMVCTSRIYEVWEQIEVQHFAESIINYMLSEEFAPKNELKMEELVSIIGL